jgi:hypothetical protein
MALDSNAKRNIPSTISRFVEVTSIFLLGELREKG